MKKILFLILFPLTLFAQTNIIEQSNGNTQTNNKGGLGLAKVFLLPLGNHDPLFEFTRYKSRVQYNESGDYIEYHNGVSWNRMIDLSYAGLNYKPIGYTPTWTEITGKPTLFSGNYNDLTNKPSLFSGNYNDLINKTTIPNYTSGSGISIASNIITNTAPDQTVTLTAGNGITITGTYPNFTISATAPVPSIVTRTLNSNFTVSSTKVSFVSYTVTCSVTNPLLVGTSSATAFLEYSINGGSTWLLPSQTGNSSGVGITVTVQLTNGQTGIVSGMIPANALVRIRTATSGTASVTYVTGQETLY